MTASDEPEAVDAAPLPSGAPGSDALEQVQGWDVAGRYRASGIAQVGGDWYDVVQVASGRVAVVIGDVSGRGAQAAPTMSRVRDAARRFLREDDDPAVTVARLNDLTVQLLPGQVVTALVALLDRTEGIRICSAGHLPPLTVDGTRTRYWDVAQGPALGLTPDAVYAVSHHALDRSATMVLYTDGLVERRGEPIDAGLERLARSGATASDFAALCDHLIGTVAAGDDDVAVVALRRKESG